jgi:hypothetical protein
MRMHGRLAPLALAVALAATDVGAAPGSDLPACPPPPRFQPPRSGVLFATNFHSGTLDGWQPDRDSVWSVRNGTLYAALPDKRQVHSFIYAGNEAWVDYAVDLDVCQTRGVDKGVAVRVQKKHGIAVDLRSGGYGDVLLHRQEWPMGRAPAPNRNGTWHHLRVEARDHTYRVFVDGTLVLDKTDVHRSRPRGRIALAAYTGGAAACEVCYANVIVTALK